jgi:DedD protein
MATLMRHKIIGSLVWLGLAIIVLPFVLDGDGLKDLAKAPTQIEMPAPIDVAPIEIETIDPAKPIALAPVADTKDKVKPEQSAAKPMTTSSNKPSLDAQGLPNSWVVQLASFKSKDKAEALLKKLLKAKFAAYVQEFNDYYRVLVGPVNTRSEADTLKGKLQQDYKLSGIVVAYNLNNQ